MIAMLDFYRFVRPLFFQLPAELSHDLALWALKNGGKYFISLPLSLNQKQSKAIKISNLTFPNKIGLAAGLDKQAACVPAWQKMGFGFIELGTVTPKPQPGNPKPRLFRYASDKAIINRFGFNSEGIDKFLANLSKFIATEKKCLWGINIGKNKQTDNELAYHDYLVCLEKAYVLADYITVNISSPNTKDLRELQEADSLAKLVDKILTARQKLAQQFSKFVPIFVKLSPDMTDASLKDTLKVLMQAKIDGIITTNTTLWRPKINPRLSGAQKAQDFYQQTGGLSGVPLFDLSTDCLKKCADITSGSMPIIASGGIDSVETAKRKLAAGASLIQVYSGLIYHGPKLIRDLVAL
jgi:dihydroorotate dehydrogenase